MQGADDAEDDDPSAPPLLPHDRPWRHPSEVGFHHRGRADRRRGTAVAGGLLLGGVALLVGGILLGAARHDGAGGTPVTGTPQDLAVSSVASVTVVRDGQRSTTTGVVIDDDGHVVVRADAVAGADEVWASCEGKPDEVVQIVASDRVSGVAVLELSPTGPPVEAADPPRIGTWVMAVRTGADDDPVMRSGTVGSAGLDVMRADGVVQPSVFVVDISGVRSDGVLFDRQGKFVGLAVPLPTEGRGLAAIPAATVIDTAEELVRTGRVEHPWIAVQGRDLPVELARVMGLDGGALVSEVAAGGPAQLAGIAPGDVVVAVDGERVTRMVGLARLLRGLEVGESAVVSVVRGTERLDLRVTAVARPEDRTLALSPGS